ncbi:MAG: lamin tail domain-containing protein [Rhodanobacteraceae bacterium]|nr:lamin tail domain-containing protein [Rhodanobacteraceae bacterium]
MFKIIQGALVSGLLAAIPSFVFAQTSDLFFSEYTEGESGSNKAVEIYNGTGTAINLANYSIRYYTNGAATPSSTTALSGTLADGDAYVICNSASIAAITTRCDLTNNTIANFNGDDILALIKTAPSIVVLDVIGQIGTDPGSEWGTSPTSTANSTLIRKAAVCIGDTDGTNPFNPATEWDGTANPVANLAYGDLGSHTANCSASVPTLTIAATASVTEGNTGCAGGSTALDFLVTSSTVAASDINFTFSTTDGTASAASDFTTTGTGTITTGNTTGNATVQVTCDDTFEANETFTVTLTDVANPAYDLGSPFAGTGTITNDDTAPTIQATPVTVNLGEAGSNTFAVTLSSAPAGTTVFDLASNDTGAATVSPAQLTFTTGDFGTPQTVTVFGVADLDLANESVTVSVSSAGYITANVTANVTDDDVQAIVVSPGSLNLNEGFGSSLSVSLAFQPAGAVTVNVASLDAGAVSVTPASLTFAPGDYAALQSITVAGEQDADSSNESTTIEFTATGVAQTDVTVNVTDDDAALPTVTISGANTVAEGNGCVTSNLSFTAFSSQTAGPGGLTVHYTVGAGVDTADGSDVALGAATATILQGENAIDFNAIVNCDFAVEFDETVTVTLNTDAAYIVGSPASAVGTISNDDANLTLSIAPVSQNEGNVSNTMTFVAQLNQTAPTGYGAVALTLTTADVGAGPNHAAAGSDYVAKTEALSIPEGQESVTFVVTINGDTAIESDEIFNVNISATSGQNTTFPSNPAAVGTIQNDDQPTLSINDVSLAEGNGGTTAFVFTVSMNAAPSSGSVTVDYATANGSATAGTDFTTASGSLSFDALNLTRTITVDVTGETAVEQDESFFLNLTNAVGATIADGQGLGTIIDDDLVTYRIHEIQGAGAFSPIVADPNPNDATIVGGAPVRVVGAIVTAVTKIAAVDGSPADQNGFFMQSADGDADTNALTSEGVLVYTGSVPAVVVGDVVTVVGQAQERFSQTQIATNLAGGSVTVTGTATLPTAVEFSSTSGLPSRDPTNLSCLGTGPGTGNNASTNFECFEGMRVSMPTAIISASNQRRASDFYGEAYATPWGARSRREAGLLFGLTPEAGNAAAGSWDGNPEVIELDYDEAGLATNTELTAGSTFSAVGVIGFSFTDYEFYPTEYTPIQTQPVPEAVMDPAGGSELTVGSFNTQHLCDDPNSPLPSDTDDPPGDDDGDNANTGDGDSDCERDTPIAGTGAFTYSEKLRKVSSYVLNVLKAPDVLGLQEVDELTTLQALAAQIAADGGPPYQSFLVEGNDPGGIDVGFMIRTDRVSGASVEQFYQTKNWYDPLVTCNPPTTDPYPCENLHDRPPLLLRATFNGTNGPYPFAVINNHTKAIGNVDETGAAAERDRSKRFQQAKDVATLAQQFQTSAGPFDGLGTAGVPLILVGDYNAFEYSDGHADVVGLIAGTYNDAANECNAVLSDSQGTETCNLGANIVNPPLFNSGLAVPESERMTYKFTQNFGVVQGSDSRDVASVQVIDHILLARTAQGYYLSTDYGISNNAASDQTNRQLPPPAGPVSPIRASDHDGMVTYLDFNCLANPVLNGDSDQVCGMLDNCPSVANDDQADMDGDGVGDVCDTDIDGDGVLNTGDNCPVTINSDQADSDNDGVGDVCDAFPNDPELLFRDGFED